jgi:hypothetical protein
MNQSSDKKYYLMKVIDVGQKAPVYPKNITYAISSIVPWTLSEKKTKKGWLGTLNNSSEYALGEFDSFESAFGEIPVNFSDRKDMTVTDPDTGRDIIVYQYYDPRDVWNVTDWLNSGNYIVGIETGEYTIQDVVDILLREAKNENIILEGNIEEEIEQCLEDRKCLYFE